MITRKQIINLFTDPVKTMENGLWFSGIEGEGEYKRWHDNGQLEAHGFYKNSKIYGEYKEWRDNGQLMMHGFYKDGKRNGEFKSWDKNGQLRTHILYKHNVASEDYLE